MVRTNTNSEFAFMRWCKLVIWLALVVVIPFGMLTAQEEPASGKVTFSAITLTDLPYENLYYRYGQKATKIELRNGRRSVPYPLSPTQFFEIYTDPVDPEDPEKTYQLVGKTSAIIGARKVLYFLRQSGASEEGELPVDLYGIDDSDANFPKGSFRFINFMDVPLGIQIGENRFIIRPNQSMVRKVTLPEEGAFTPFVVTNEEGKVIGGTRLFSHSSNREMVLIFPPKKGRKRLDIRYFSD